MKEVPVEDETTEVTEEQETLTDTTENTVDNTAIIEETSTDNTTSEEKKEEVKTELKEVEVEYTKHYAEIILEAAKQSNMSPYSIVTKIIQEVGTKGSSSVSGTYEGYKGYYNFYNLGAYDSGNAIVNGLKYARDKQWNNQYVAIIEGAKEIANSYTNAGQNTAYFYKWDVVGTKILTSGETQKVSGSNLFWHQYMTNVQDPTSQSKSLYNTYAKNNVLDKALNFIIPIYDNMPANSNSLPSGLTTDDGDLYYVNCTGGLRVRSNPTTSSTKLDTLSKNTVVAMIERECAEADGYKWDKVRLANGVTGYIASKYLTFKAASTAVPEPQEPETPEQPDTPQEPGQTETPDETKEPENNGVEVSNKFKIEETNIVMIPGVELKDIHENATGELKTGGKIKIDDKEYTVVVKGDTNGDGEIKATDYMRIKNHIMGTAELTEAQIKAADVNGDGETKATDYMKIKNYIMGSSDIEI